MWLEFGIVIGMWLEFGINWFYSNRIPEFAGNLQAMGHHALTASETWITTMACNFIWRPDSIEPRRYPESPRSVFMQGHSPRFHARTEAEHALFKSMQLVWWNMHVINLMNTVMNADHLHFNFARMQREKWFSVFGNLNSTWDWNFWHTRSTHDFRQFLHTAHDFDFWFVTLSELFVDPHRHDAFDM